MSWNKLGSNYEKRNKVSYLLPATGSKMGTEQLGAVVENNFVAKVRTTTICTTHIHAASKSCPSFFGGIFFVLPILNISVTVLISFFAMSDKHDVC